MNDPERVLRPGISMIEPVQRHGGTRSGRCEPSLPRFPCPPWRPALSR